MKSIASLLFLVLTFNIYAQELTPYQKKQQREAAEKQLQNKTKLDEYSIHDNKLFDSQSIPDQFKNESVVIVAQSYYYEYKTKRGVPVLTERIKKRIFLKDKAAVESNSTFYSNSDGTQNPIEIKIVKSSGKVEELSLKDGVKETNSSVIPYYYKSGFSFDQSYYKYAIPNLEPGDFIDYTVIYDNTNVNTSFLSWYLNTTYPVLKSQIKISIAAKYYAYLKSLNGAPTFKETSTPEGVITLFMQDSMRAKIGNDWLLPYEKYVPLVKILISSAKEFTYNEPVFPINVKTDKRIQNKLNDKDFYQISNSFLPWMLYHSVTSHMEREFPKLKPSMDAYYEKAWYLLKDLTLEGESLIRATNANGYTFYGVSREIVMLGTIAIIMNENKLPVELIITTTNRECSIDDIVYMQEASYILKYKEKYIPVPYYNTKYGELPPYYYGSKAYSIKNFNYKTALNNKSMLLTKFTLPDTNPNESLIRENISIAFNNEEFEKLNVKRTSYATSYNVGDYLEDFFNRDLLNQLAYYTKTRTPVDSTKLYIGKASEKAEKMRKDKEAQAEYHKSVLTEYENNLKDDYPLLDKYNSYKIYSSGMIPDSLDFKIEENFTLQGLTSQVGSGYVFQLGYLLGKYNKFENEDRERNYPGKVKKTNTVEFIIEFTIPDGYKVASLAEFSKSFDDGLMSFKSEAVQSDNKIIFTVKRTYKKTDFTIAEYQTIVKYYDTMDALTQTKIIIKPIN